MTRIVVLDPLAPQRLDRMRAFLPEGWRLDTTASRAAEDQKAGLQGADFAIVSDVPVTAAMMAVPGLRAVHKWGVGYDAIDLVAARANGVRVLRTTGSNAVPVAETALGLILSVNRNITRGHVAVQAGAWPKSELAATSVQLSGRTVGIVGMGHVGKALARLLRGFGCHVLYTKRNPLTGAEEAEAGVRFAPLEALLGQSDVVVLCCELNDSTRGMIDSARLALMQPGAALVNVARGGVVIEADLARALRAGRLRAAGVDVFSVEPVSIDNPLRDIDQAILTPHLAALSVDGFEASVTRMMSNLAAIQAGGEPAEIDVLV